MSNNNTGWYEVRDNEGYWHRIDDSQYYWYVSSGVLPRYTSEAIKTRNALSEALQFSKDNSL